MYSERLLRLLVLLHRADYSVNTSRDLEFVLGLLLLRWLLRPLRLLLLLSARSRPTASTTRATSMRTGHALSLGLLCLLAALCEAGA